MPNGPLGPKIVGKVVNKTGKDWIAAHFGVDVFDTSGNTLITSSFTIYDLNKDQVKPIGFFADGVAGEYPAKYVFRLVKPTDSRELLFRDGQLDIQFSPSQKQISFYRAEQELWAR